MAFFTDRAAGVYKATSVKDNMDPTQPRDGVNCALRYIAHELYISELLCCLVFIFSFVFIDGKIASPHR
jgi:hypothetical protein